MIDEKTEELMDELAGSLRRAEHSYYVSLKYTRTVDVIKNLLERLGVTIKTGGDVLAHKLFLDKKIMEAPSTIIEVVNVVKEHYKEDEIITNALDLLLLLRRVNRAEYSRSEEFRRHVEMRVVLEGNEYVFNIDNLLDYYEQVRTYVLHIRKMVYHPDSQ